MGWLPNDSPGGEARVARPVYGILSSLNSAPSAVAGEVSYARIDPLPDPIVEPDPPAEPVVASSPPASPVVELEEIQRHFGTDSIVRALNGVTLRIERGASLAIVGPSGSGKSTLMNVIGLLDRPTAGRYRLDGIDMDTLGERERAGIRATKIGFVFQAFHLLAHRTALENVMLRDAYRGSPRAGRRERAVEMLRRVGMGHRIDSLPSKLSGGERQRVAIARALLGNPSLLLCDEPTGNLDSENTAAVLYLFDELVASGITLVVVTHERDVAKRMDSQVDMIDGRINEHAVGIRPLPGTSPPIQGE
jgi:ABC-type lipoprotein export system ATPase subunit